MEKAGGRETRKSWEGRRKIHLENVKSEGEKGRRKGRDGSKIEETSKYGRKKGVMGKEG